MLYGQKVLGGSSCHCPSSNSPLVVGTLLSCRRYYDFRAPENYVFLPDWMMKALGLRPRDTVKLRHVKLPGMYLDILKQDAFGVLMDYLDPRLYIERSLVPYFAPHPVSFCRVSVWRQTAAW